MREPIYLDGLSSMRLGPAARAAMMDAWERPGNAGSPHAWGAHAAAIVERGRNAVADLVGAAPGEIVFTSGATEANNLAIIGTALAALKQGRPRRRIVVSAIEHRAVLGPALRLRELGFRVALAPVTRGGVVDLEALRSLVDEDTLLVSVMSANNETGALQPIAQAAGVARAAGALFHSDAAQTVGRVPVDVLASDIDYMSLSAHKMGGPLGIGALYVSSAAPRPEPITTGGGHEGGLRPGTEPAPLVAGMGAAAEAAGADMAGDASRCEGALAALLAELSSEQVHHRINTATTERLPGAVSLQLVGVDAQSISQSLSSTVMLSTGSACNSGQITTSYVLRAMGMLPNESAGTLRLYCHADLSREEAVAAARLIAAQVRNHE